MQSSKVGKHPRRVVGAKYAGWKVELMEEIALERGVTLSTLVRAWLDRGLRGESPGHPGWEENDDPEAA